MPLSKMVLVPFERYQRIVGKQRGENECQEEVTLQRKTPQNSLSAQTGEGEGTSSDTSRTHSPPSTPSDSQRPQPPPGDPDVPLSSDLVDKEETGLADSWFEVWKPLPSHRK